MTDNSPATDEEIAAFDTVISRDPGNTWDDDVVLALIARIRAETAKNSGEVVHDELCGAIAYELTTRMVIDLPTARAAVDAAVKEGIHMGYDRDPEYEREVACSTTAEKPSAGEAYAYAKEIMDLPFGYLHQSFWWEQRAKSMAKAILTAQTVAPIGYVGQASLDLLASGKGDGVALYRYWPLSGVSHAPLYTSPFGEQNSGEAVGTVYTMEALPGGDIKYHVSLIKPLPAGTKLYASPANSRTETIGEREAEIRTHLSAWRRALVIAKEHAEVSPPDIDDKAYWQHEIDALDRALLGGVSHG